MKNYKFSPFRWNNNFILGEPSYWIIDSIHTNFSEDKSILEKKDNVLIKMVHYTERMTPGVKRIAVDKKILSDLQAVIDFGKVFEVNQNELREHYSNVSFCGRVHRLPYFNADNIGFLQAKQNESLEKDLKLEIDGLIEKAEKIASKDIPEDNDIEPTMIKGAIVKIFVFNVGQGDSILIELPTKELWMIDAYFVSRSRFSYDAFMTWMNVNYKGKSIKRLVLSHLHHDHIKSAHKIIHDFRVQEVIFTPSLNHPSPTAINLFKYCNDIGVLKTLAGDEIKRYPGLNVTLKRTCDFNRGISLGTDPNNHGIVIILETKESFAFLPGDIPALLLNNLQNYFNKTKNKKFRFYKVTHHCSQTGSHGNFLNSLNPTDAVTSCSRMNSFGHPSTQLRDIIDRLTNKAHIITGYQNQNVLPYYLV